MKFEVYSFYRNIKNEGIYKLAQAEARDVVDGVECEPGPLRRPQIRNTTAQGHGRRRSRRLSANESGLGRQAKEWH